MPGFYDQGQTYAMLNTGTSQRMAQHEAGRNASAHVTFRPHLVLLCSSQTEQAGIDIAQRPSSDDSVASAGLG
jgi:hypothetical protein